MAADRDDELLGIQRKFEDFLQQDDGPYTKKIEDMIAKDESRLLVNVADLRQFDDEFCQKALDAPARHLPCFDKAFKKQLDHDHGEYVKKAELSKTQFSVGFEGDFGAHEVSPRTLSSVHVNKLICIRGIVTKCSLVRPKVLKSVHYCEETKQTVSKEYRDYTSFSGLPTGSTYLTRDESGNLLTTEYGMCEYTDSQALHLQEAPEHSEVGQLPRSVDVLVTNDLVDKVKPGDRVMVVGVYKPLGGGNDSSGTFRTVVIGINVRSMAKEQLQANYNDADIANFRKIAAQKEHFNKMAASLAPSICGHDFVKKGLLLLLAGGQEKNLANGTHLRGDINMLLVGDPSVAKSQMLRYVMNVAPLAVSTTGRGSSGVGLTAAITQDSETGERKLEAGAMVLADRGVVCIDEFDKMSDEDRVAIHEVMEQQTVTIAKAGIHTSLNARCSVLAAANPVYGSYNRQKKATENIGLPDSLLSRFDLLFILLDHVEEAHDKRISDHVLRVHRYRGAEGEDALADDDLPQQDAESDEPTVMYDKFDKHLHGSKESAKDIYTQAFVKKFLRYVSKIRPRLDGDASEKIASLYQELRRNNDIASGALPITPRTLETIIRLSCAHAKLRLSALVESQDVEEAYAVMRFALLNETSANSKLRGIAEEDETDDDEGGPGGGEDDDEGGDDDAPAGGKGSGSKRARRQTPKDDEDEGGGDAEGGSKRSKRGGDSGDSRSPAKAKATKGASSKEAEEQEMDPNSARFADVEKAINKVRSHNDEATAFDDFLQKINRTELKPKIKRPELKAIIDHMHNNNLIYYDSGNDTVTVI